MISGKGEHQAGPSAVHSDMVMEQQVGPIHHRARCSDSEHSTASVAFTLFGNTDKLP